jgi:hypothetical protein
MIESEQNEQTKWLSTILTEFDEVIKEISEELTHSYTKPKETSPDLISKNKKDKTVKDAELTVSSKLDALNLMKPLKVDDTDLYPNIDYIRFTHIKDFPDFVRSCFHEYLNYKSDAKPIMNKLNEILSNLKFFYGLVDQYSPQYVFPLYFFLINKLIVMMRKPLKLMSWDGKYILSGSSSVSVALNQEINDCSKAIEYIDQKCSMEALHNQLLKIKKNIQPDNSFDAVKESLITYKVKLEVNLERIRNFDKIWQTCPDYRSMFDFMYLLPVSDFLNQRAESFLTGDGVYNANFRANLSEIKKIVGKSWIMDLYLKAFKNQNALLLKNYMLML